MADLKLTIDDLHDYCSTMLKDITTECENNNIPYYLIYGSLLGAVRHNGPIPWDPDVDLYIPEFELNRFITAIENKYSNKYWVDFRNDGITPKPFPRIGLKGYETEILHIDIFRMSGLPNNKFKQVLLTKRGRNLWVLWKAKTINPRTYYVDKKKRAVSYLLKLASLPLSVEHIINTIDLLCNM